MFVTNVTGDIYVHNGTYPQLKTTASKLGKKQL